MQFIVKKEFYFFLFIILGHALPVLCFTLFPSMDGPTHLYNSSIIIELLGSKEGILSQFIVFNDSIVPNWIGHLFLIFFNLFGSPIFAEKAFLLLYIFGFPISFRYMLKQFSPHYKIYSYTIFPFLFSHLFCLGFYNFSFAFIFLFISAGYAVKVNQKMFKLKQLFVFFSLFLLLYLSHIVIYGIGFLIVGAIILLNSHNNWKQKLNNTFILIISASFTVVLSIIYFSKHLPGDSNKKYIEATELLSSLINNTSLIAYNIEIENNYTRIITICILALLVLPPIYILIKNRNVSFSGFVRKNLIWILLPITMLVALFIAPNESGGAGFISLRFQYLFFLFLLPLISLLKFNTKVRLIIVSVMCICSFSLQYYYTKVSRDLNYLAKNVYELADKVESDDIVLPINFNNNWLSIHFSNYLGVKNKALILENYELSTDYFPMHWNKNTSFENFRIAYNKMHDSKQSVQDILTYSKKLYTSIFIIGDIPVDTKYNALKQLLQQDYVLIESNDNCQLYKLKLS